MMSKKKFGRSHSGRNEVSTAIFLIFSKHIIFNPLVPELKYL